jgi:hypothetical protein
MKALTMKPPWTWCILRLGKDIENRTWRPGPHELKPGDWFALHNGKTPKGRAMVETWALAQSLALRAGVEVDDQTVEDVFREGIVGVARFGGIVEASDSPWFEGRYGWKLDEVIALPTPIVCPGLMGLWAVPRGSRVFLERQVADLGRVLA